MHCIASLGFVLVMKSLTVDTCTLGLKCCAEESFCYFIGNISRIAISYMYYMRSSRFFLNWGKISHVHVCTIPFIVWTIL